MAGARAKSRDRLPGVFGILTGVLATFALHTVMAVLFVGLGLLTGLVVEELDAATRQAIGEPVTIGFLGALTLFGLTQLVYMIPAVLVAFFLRFRSVALGMIIGAVITFLLNAGCWTLIGGSLGLSLLGL